MNYDEKLEQIKNELYGNNYSSIDGYQNQIGLGNFDYDKFNKVISLFKEVASDAKTKDPVYSEILGHYTNFAIDTVSLLLSRNYEDYDQIVKELENLF